MSTVITDVRCPVGANTLLMRVLSEGGEPIRFEDQRMQLHCKECSRDFRKIRDNIQRVLHIYSMDGEFLLTQIQFKDGEDQTIDVETQLRIIRLNSRFTRGNL